MYSKLTASLREKFLTGGIFVTTFLLLLVPLYFQYITPFSLPIFFATLVCLIVSGVSFYYFMQSIVCPKLQVYDKFVIVTGLKRIVIKRDLIKECLVTHKDVTIVYTDGEMERRIQIKVSEDASHIIKLMRK